MQAEKKYTHSGMIKQCVLERQMFQDESGFGYPKDKYLKTYVGVTKCRRLFYSSNKRVVYSAEDREILKVFSQEANW